MTEQTVLESNSDAPSHWITMGLRFEPKKRNVALRQLPKTTENRRYMTLLLCRDKTEISAEAVQAMGEALDAWIKAHDNTLHWRPLVARGACTYGRFDDEFEELLLRHRPGVGEKDLPWEDHPDLPREERPCFAHMRHRDLPDTDPRKHELLHFKPGTVFTFRIEPDE